MRKISTRQFGDMHYIIQGYPPTDELIACKITLLFVAGCYLARKTKNYLLLLMASDGAGV